MNDWGVKQIKSLGRVVTGKTPPTNNPEYFGGDELFVSPKDLDWSSHYITETETRITSKALEKFKNQVVPRNTVMFTSLSFAFGKMGIASRPCLTNQQINSVIVNKENSPKFVYYLLRAYEPIIFSYNSGIDTPIVPKSVFEKIEVKLPSKKLQEKIAAILSAYDDLIENNQRRIALLEKMAEEIYREWFVRFRFPGRKKVKSIKGVPEGWKVVELKEVSIESSRSTSSGSHLAERLYLPLELFNTRQMIPGGHQNYTEAQSSLVTFEKGDILFGAMRPYQHKVAMAPFPGITRTTCFVIRPKMPLALSWLFLTLYQQTSVDYATMICNGADRPYVVWNKGMERMKLLRPDDVLLAKFEEVARPILDSISSMYFVQLKLKDCRDLLLPRLISGKLSVGNLDIQFPPGMVEPVHET